MKLWDKGKHTSKKILEFTAGKDRELDHFIAGFDIIASIAHVDMLGNVNLISQNEKKILIDSLLDIYYDFENDKFLIDEGMEDVHSQVEKILTERLGDTGKRIHTARSRNDQVITDLKLFYRDEIISIVKNVSELAQLLISKSEETKDVIIPGYTHLQAAMPSSFGLWFGAYSEALVEDLQFVKGVFDYINQNPLGSAAGYGSSFPVDRDHTTELLEFDDMHVNSVNAQLSRGKTEKFLVSGISAFAASLSKMAFDLVLFMSQNFDFVRLNEDLTTGSSIMPHKKNPDVLELIRAKCNRIQSKENEIKLIINNLPSGYHRDFQLLKEICFPVISEMNECLEMMGYVVLNLEVNPDVTQQEIYKYIGSVDAINEKVKDGVPFREAYSLIAMEIDKGRFRPVRGLEYTHQGSIGNLSNERITKKLKLVLQGFQTEKYGSFRERFIQQFKEKQR